MPWASADSNSGLYAKIDVHGGAVAVANFPATQPVSGTVAVSNLPATQAVSGTVSVGNQPTVHCVTGTSDAECRSTVLDGGSNTETTPMFVKTAGDGGSAFVGLRGEMVFGLGVIVFLVASFWWATVGRVRAGRR